MARGSPPFKDLVEGVPDREQNVQRPKSGLASVFREQRERRCLDSQGVSKGEG